jgi:hypothetical protein
MKLIPFHKLNKKLKSEDTSGVSPNHTIRTKAKFDVSSVGNNFYSMSVLNLFTSWCLAGWVMRPKPIFFSSRCGSSASTALGFDTGFLFPSVRLFVTNTGAALRR